MFCACHAFLSFHCSLVVTCWEMTDILDCLYVKFSCVLVTFPCGVLGQVRCLIVSIPGLCLLSYLITPGADLVLLFPLLLPLRTEIKCAGTSVLAYARVLRIPRWCRQNSHVTCSRTRWQSTASMCGNICIA